jgi:hypothetical protein
MDLRPGLLDREEVQVVLEGRLWLYPPVRARFCGQEIFNFGEAREGVLEGLVYLRRPQSPLPELVEGVQLVEAIISTGLIIGATTAWVEQVFLVLLRIMGSLVQVELEVLAAGLLFSKAAMADMLAPLEHHKLRVQQPTVQELLEQIQGCSDLQVL